MTPKRRAFLIGAVAGLVIGGAVLIGRAWGQAPGELVKCDSIHVVDGDSLHCNNIRIRLWGIDAPDFACKGRPSCFEAPTLAEVSKRALRAIVQAGDTFCKLRSTDRYGRAVAICYSGGNDIGCQLIRQGHAVEWHRYSRGAYRECAARP